MRLTASQHVAVYGLAQTMAWREMSEVDRERHWKEAKKVFLESQASIQPRKEGG